MHKKYLPRNAIKYCQKHPKSSTCQMLMSVRGAGAHLENSGHEMTQSATDAEEVKYMVFGISYKAVVPVYVPTVDGSYIAIRCEWISGLIGDEIGKLHDCYIAEFFDGPHLNHQNMCKRAIRSVTTTGKQNQWKSSIIDCGERAR